MVSLDPRGSPALRSPQADQFKLAIASWGNPAHPKTWSGTGVNLTNALNEQGVPTVGVNFRPNNVVLGACMMLHKIGGEGGDWRQSARVRLAAARRIAAALRSTGIRSILHLSGNDLGFLPATGTVHYLYCDTTWRTAHRYATSSQSGSYFRSIDAIHRRGYHQMRAIFVTAAYVKESLVNDYAIPDARVTVVGSGAGSVQSYNGPKDYTSKRLLFVAKNRFEAKGTYLLIDAYRLAFARDRDLELVLVGPDELRAAAAGLPGVRYEGVVSLERLTKLFQEAALYVMPALDESWGLVYLEALNSRTPVLGLARHALPEITDNGRVGFLVDSATPRAVAEAIVSAMRDPAKLARMGASGQRQIQSRYNWQAVAAKMIDIMHSSYDFA